MKSHRTIIAAGTGIFLFIVGLIAVGAQPAASTPPPSKFVFAPDSNSVAKPNASVPTAPMYVPDYSRAGQALPDGVIAWDAIMKSVDVTDGMDFAHFTFYFTNIATTAVVTLTTNQVNGTSQTTATTNHIPSQLVILNVHPSCGCTTAELPPTPWIIPPGSNEEMKVKVNLEGKSGTVIKSVAVTTDFGQKSLMLRINIHPAPAVQLTDAQKMSGISAAKADRMAVFKGDCASCHVPKNIQGMYGQQLFHAMCAICHEAENRATMVPDLGNLKVPTNVEFWRTWTTYGKPGSLMPAFATSQGGPLTDMQVASLAQYLTFYHPSKVQPTPQ